MPPKITDLKRPVKTSDVLVYSRHVGPGIGGIDAEEINADNVAGADAESDSFWSTTASR